MGSCRYCKVRMAYDEFVSHRCPWKVESELFAQRFPDKEDAARAAFCAAFEKRRRAMLRANRKVNT